MIPTDSALGLPHGALRLWAVLALVVCGALSMAVALAPERRRPAGRRRDGLLVFAVALLVRAGFSMVQDGGLYDVFDAYRIVGDQLRHGGDVFVEPALGLSNYPPVIYWWWALAAAVPTDHPHLYSALIRLPFWVADAAVAPLLLGLVRRAGRGRWLALRAAWMYALSPIALAVPTLHGQFEPLVVIPLLVGVVVMRDRPLLGGLLTGVATAVKPWPLFFVIPLLALLSRREWPRFIAGVAAMPVAAFALYAAVHPAHVLAGVYRVVTYVAHRQGLGSSVLFGERAPVAVITAANLAAGLAASVAGVVAARRRRAPAEVIAVAMLILLVLSPTVSDQYLMWPVPFLLLAGRLRTVALLTVGVLPAVAWLNLWTSQNGGATPAAILLLATLTMGLAAMHLVRARPVDPVAAQP